MFKPIKGWEGLYSVDEDGNIYSEERMIYSGSRGKYRKAQRRILKPNLFSRYLFVILRESPRHKMVYIHQIVANTFVPNTENKPEVNHIDGNKWNNHASNLEWVTKSENKLHSTQILKRGSGISHGMAKLSEEQVIAIRDERKLGTPFQKIADKYEIAKQTVIGICKGETWKNLPGILTKDDMKFDNRVKGERCNRSKLTEVQVRSLRYDREKGHTYKQLSEKYGISGAQASYICNNKSWKHLT
jgi:hypothetical protein